MNNCKTPSTCALNGCDCPAPKLPAWQDVLGEAEMLVKQKPIFAKYIKGTILENDVPVWIADFAQRAVMRDRAATQPARRWVERWHGSGPDRGWWVWEANHGNPVAYIGEGDHSERLTSILVEKHNAAAGVMVDAPGEPTEQQIVRLALKHNLGSDAFDRARLLEFARELRALGVALPDGFSNKPVTEA